MVRHVLLALLASAAAWCSSALQSSLAGTSTRRLHERIGAQLSSADEERLLLSEPALSAFIAAEVRSFALDSARVGGDEIEAAAQRIAAACEDAFSAACKAGILANISVLLAFWRGHFEEPELEATLERVGLSPYQCAHHMTDMLHHCKFRGAYTKTLAPSGSGEVAARSAVGLPALAAASHADDDDDDADECLVRSPTGACLQTKSEAAEAEGAWRKRRFERVQMEGTRDPRRGMSGSTR